MMHKHMTPRAKPQRPDARTDARRHREVVRGWVFLVLGFIQTTGAVTTAALAFGLGFHRITWTSFGVTMAALIVSRVLHWSDGRG